MLPGGMSNPKVATSNAIRYPLLVYGILASIYSGYYANRMNFNWFSFHPLSMMLAFVVLSGNAIMIKKIGGYVNTRNHGYLMGAATLLGLFGWYVIHSNKEKFMRKHLLTLHGKLGAFVLVMYTLLAVGGALALNPHNGILRTNQTVRFYHKWGGKGLTFLAWTSCVLGFTTMESNVYIQGGFILPLLIFGFYVLL